VSEEISLWVGIRGHKLIALYVKDRDQTHRKKEISELSNANRNWLHKETLNTHINRRRLYTEINTETGRVNISSRSEQLYLYSKSLTPKVMNQLLNTFPVSYWTRRFSTKHRRGPHRSLSWPSWNQPMSSHPISLRSILILSSYPRLAITSGLL
jgi:hypothetical protein